jgi:hypothetical protein
MEGWRCGADGLHEVWVLVDDKVYVVRIGTAGLHVRADRYLSITNDGKGVDSDYAALADDVTHRTPSIALTAIAKHMANRQTEALIDEELQELAEPIHLPVKRAIEQRPSFRWWEVTGIAVNKCILHPPNSRHRYSLHRTGLEGEVQWAADYHRFAGDMSFPQDDYNVTSASTLSGLLTNIQRHFDEG